MSTLLLEKPAVFYNAAGRGRNTPKRFTGAAVGRVCLVFATVQLFEDIFELCEDASCQFPLPERDQESVRRLHRNVQEFVAGAEITDILLRQRNTFGQQSSSGGHFKVEAVLQLIPGLVTRSVPAVTVNTWSRKPHFEAPECGQVELRWQQTMQGHAIATACLAEMMNRGPLPWQRQGKQDG